MKVTFTVEDRAEVMYQLKAAGLDAADEAIDDILESVAKAFVQQFSEEVAHFVLEVEETVA